MGIHVITATKHGSTREIGEAIARRLRDRGHQVKEHDMADEPALETAEPVTPNRNGGRH
ncbi:MAG: hypothetical protein AABM66_01110 [Actinomycetota bacterium]